MINVLLIVPPFGSCEIQSLAMHTLQACGKEAGYNVDILYANMEFAARIGDLYNDYCKMNYFLLGERPFAKTAWGDSVPEQFGKDLYDYFTLYKCNKSPVRFFPEDSDIPVKDLIKTANYAGEWISELYERFRDIPYNVVGVTSSFEQINAGVSILRAIKSSNPNVVTFTGGFNCEGDSAIGIVSLDPDREFLDYVFSGESEVSFVNFLHGLNSGVLPKERVIYSEPVMDLDGIPDLDYSDFFTQLERWLPEKFANKGGLSLAMESSRGCWWGEKSQCCFCGTSDRVKYRQKSEDRLLREFESAKKWGIKYLHMADLIMPYSFFSGFLQKIATLKDGWKFYYEEKAGLTHQQLIMLKNAGVTDIQPGIESLSTTVLNKMQKGNTLKQNIQFLRDATNVGISVFWNMVWGVPGETIEDYERVVKLIPLIEHLIPPLGAFHMTLVKFSPCLNYPQKFGISNIKPIDSYRKVFPEWADSDKIAIIHSGDYKYETLNSDVIERVIKLAQGWRDKWRSEFSKPRLHICKQGNGSVVLLDTRGLDGTDLKCELSDNLVRLLLKNCEFTGSSDQIWAINKKIAISEDGYFIPLPTFEDEIRGLYE